MIPDIESSAGPSPVPLSRLTAVRLALSVLALAGGTTAAAQSSAPTGAASTGDSVLPAVTVRSTVDADMPTEGTGAYTAPATRAATGLSLSRKDTPQAVSIITRQQIEDQGMSLVTDTLLSAPGVALVPVDRGRNSLSVRGFDVQTFLFDGLPFLSGNVGLEEMSTAMYDRVEVVRGATGLVTGAGDPSAAINLVRKRADSRTLTGTAEFEVGSWKRIGATADVSTPLNADGSVRARIVAQSWRQDGFIDLERRRGTLLYGVIDADLTSTTRLSIGASQQDIDRKGVLWYPLPRWYTDGSHTNWNRAKTSAARWNQWDTTEQTAFATLEQSLANDWKLRADASYHRQREYSSLIWFGDYPDRETGLGMTATPYNYLAKPQQVNLALNASGPFSLFGRQHEAAIGLAWNRLKDGWYGRDPIDSPESAGNFNTWDGSYPTPVWGERYRMSGFGTTVQTALHGVTRLRLTDSLKLIVGARISNWKRDDEESRYGEAQVQKVSGKVTPYAGLIYDLNPNLAVYASYSDIFKPQTNRDRNGNYLDPLVGKSTELGLKGEWFGGRLQGSAALFRIAQDNFAVVDEGQFVPGTTTPAMRGAQGTVSKGYELELVGQVSPQWQVNASWSQYQARDGDGEQVVPYHPRRLLRLSTVYQFADGWSPVRVGGGLRWQSRPPLIGTSPTGVEERVGQPAYSVVDLWGRYTFDRNWSLQLNIYNLFDKAYYNSSYWAGYLYGEPRNARLTLRYRF